MSCQYNTQGTIRCDYKKEKYADFAFNSFKDSDNLINMAVNGADYLCNSCTTPWTEISPPVVPGCGTCSYLRHQFLSVGTNAKLVCENCNGSVEKFAMVGNTNSFMQCKTFAFVNNKLYCSDNASRDILVSVVGQDTLTVPSIRKGEFQFNVGSISININRAPQRILGQTGNPIHFFNIPIRGIKPLIKLQNQGNLVIYNANNINEVIWASSGGNYGAIPSGTPPYTLKLLEWGELVIDDVNLKRWWTNAPASSMLTNKIMRPEDPPLTLEQNQGITPVTYTAKYNQNGTFTIIHTARNKSTVLYTLPNKNFSIPNPGYASMRHDGNFVLYDANNNYYWASAGGSFGPMPNGYAPYTLRLLHSGTLAIIDSRDNIWWRSPNRLYPPLP